jgi:hypothetical protein
MYVIRGVKSNRPSDPQSICELVFHGNKSAVFLRFETSPKKTQRILFSTSCIMKEMIFRRGFRMGKFAIALAIISGGIAALSKPLLENRQTWKGTSRSEAGVTIVENPAKPIYEENILELIPEFIIPGDDKNGQYTLFRIGDVSVDDQGRIYVLDIRDFSVKVFDDHGRYLRNIGRSGIGPGELDSCYEIEVASDSLYALSTGSRRIHIFRLNGQYQKSLQAPAFLSQIRVDRGGNIFGIEHNPPLDKIVYCDSNFKIDKTYASRKPWNQILFTSWLSFDLGMNGDIVVGNPSDYEFFVYGRSGELKKIIKKKSDPIRIPDEDIKRYRASVERLPKYFEAYYRVFADDQGHFLVNTHYFLSAGNKAFFDVFDEGGKYLSSFDLKNNLHILWKNGRLYTADEDKDGLPVVRVFKALWKR